MGISVLEYDKKILSSYLLEALGQNQKYLLGPVIEDSDLPNKKNMFVDWTYTGEKWIASALLDDNKANKNKK